MGEFDDQGFLKITDRKKDLIITAGGKNVAPQNLEKKLRAIDGISQAVVIGDRRKYLTALLTLCPERAPKLAENRGWPTNLHNLSEDAGFRSHVETAISDHLNNQLARYEQIKTFAILGDDFTQETGELTPTQKLKRNVIVNRHHALIESMYPNP